ncbi:MAG: putative manganese-dependent inorganic diphosphatase [Faecalicoccus sp.]|uniref:putative manganese-dependent inorganic diphosphatase n=2 Tax=Erysipelotrichaceae TaxID=128827 RepID=UPI00232F2AE1|nr:MULTISPECIES: putative manganese-dependent inorganic diphosphatase [Faecalicoccus]MCI6379333.1 putative manganese-dependent inorganic diphosphatase [Erysipelotrichaceae bacterium]MDB7987721.1 putative manganese-dependent inorganic diphosphatase [Faecalicoccus pleomorphus]MDB7992234.1 putative manganese-dependent inorganic diphosphatase [Faecalicoccus pleomorphus]MDY4869176.1 putative manganese-dependent inorganic diphosphatase [Faecalicoccus sp.]
MMQQEPLYITGHIHPDTDSVASAIGYAFLKRAMGIPAKACRLGNLNTETRYLLERFHFEEPELLEDARIQLQEMQLDHPVDLNPETTIFETLQLMQSGQGQGFGVTDENGVLIGIVTRSDISFVGLGDTAQGIDLLKETPVENIVKTISGKLVYRDENRHINGKVSIVALTKNHVKNYDIQDRIVIIGDDTQAQSDLIRKGAGMLVMVWTKEVQPEVIELAKQYHCQLVLSGHGSMNTSRYLYFSVPIGLIMTKKVVTFSDYELAEDVSRKMLKTRYRMYPVVNKKYQPIGYVTRYHMMNYTNKKIVMVDHNEFSQSVKGIEQAELVEVLDHHRICDFATSKPVSFRNEIVGSTATIVAKIFKENQIPIPKDLAGLLLGAVLSDTLKFQSPTTTQKDIEVANMLAAFASLDIDAFATDMFTVSSDISGKSVEQLVNTDIKYFEIRNQKLMISQVIIPCVDYVLGLDEEIEEELSKLVKQRGLDVCVGVFTSILENGSVFFAAGPKKHWVEEAFPSYKNRHIVQKNILSRKNQIVPMLTDVITKS